MHPALKYWLWAAVTGYIQVLPFITERSKSRLVTKGNFAFLVSGDSGRSLAQEDIRDFLWEAMGKTAALFLCFVGSRDFRFIVADS